MTIMGRYKIHNDINQFIVDYDHINYCEIAIGPDGLIYELVNSSHQDMLVHIAFGKFWWQMDESEVNSIYSELLNAEPLEYLCAKTGCCALWWYYMAIPRQGITEVQFDVIRRLYDAGKHKVNLTSMAEFPENVGYSKNVRVRYNI